MSTNMPGIGLVICEIRIKISEIWEIKITFIE